MFLDQLCWLQKCAINYIYSSAQYYLKFAGFCTHFWVQSAAMLACFYSRYADMVV